MKKGMRIAALLLVLALVTGLASVGVAQAASEELEKSVTVSGPELVSTDDIINVVISMSGVSGASAQISLTGLEIVELPDAWCTETSAVLMELAPTATYKCRVTAKVGEACSFDLSNVTISDGHEDIPLSSRSLKCQVTDVKITATDAGNGKYTLRVTNLDNAKLVQLPTWSGEYGQDDIVWYEAKKQDDGTWTLDVDTNWHGGNKMTTHAYADGRLVAATGYTAPAPQGPYATAENLGGSKYRLVVRNAENASSAQLPTWSLENGQDDLVWYQAEKQDDGTWCAVMDTDEHGGGTIVTHAYADGKLVGATICFAPITTGPYAKVEKSGNSEFKVTVRNVDGGHRMQLATWSDYDGQDDLAWYDAEKQNDGTWTASIDTKKHGDGMINIHVYVDGDFVCSTRFDGSAA